MARCPRCKHVGQLVKTRRAGTLCRSCVASDARRAGDSRFDPVAFVRAQLDLVNNERGWETFVRRRGMWVCVLCLQGFLVKPIGHQRSRLGDIYCDGGGSLNALIAKAEAAPAPSEQ